MTQNLFLNLKNYPDPFRTENDSGIKLATEAMKVSIRDDVRVVLVPPHLFAAHIALTELVPVYSQSITAGAEQRSTGDVTAQMARIGKLKGTFLNHSESPLKPSEIAMFNAAARDEGLEVCVFARNLQQVKDFALLTPSVNAIVLEPEEYIGGNKAVSIERPELIREALEAIRGLGRNSNLYVGGGIKTAQDALAAKDSGANGIVVSSIIGRASAHSWELKLHELASALR